MAVTFPSNLISIWLKGLAFSISDFTFYWNGALNLFFGGFFVVLPRVSAHLHKPCLHWAIIWTPPENADVMLTFLVTQNNERKSVFCFDGSILFCLYTFLFVKLTRNVNEWEGFVLFCVFLMYYKICLHCSRLMHLDMVSWRWVTVNFG